MAYHEKGTRVRVIRNVVIPQYRAPAIVIVAGATGTVVKPFPGEEAYNVLLDSARNEDDVHFLYDYEVEEIKQ